VGVEGSGSIRLIPRPRRPRDRRTQSGFHALIVGHATRRSRRSCSANPPRLWHAERCAQSGRTTSSTGWRACRTLPTIHRVRHSRHDPGPLTRGSNAGRLSDRPGSEAARFGMRTSTPICKRAFGSSKCGKSSACSRREVASRETSAQTRRLGSYCVTPTVALRATRSIADAI
jgi:hypothetical protein